MTLPRALTLVALLALGLATLRAEEPAGATEDAAFVASYVAAKEDLVRFREAGLARDVAFASSATAAVQSRFRAEIIDREFPEERAGPLSRLYSKLDLLPEGYDIRKELDHYLEPNSQPYYYSLASKSVLIAEGLEYPAAMRGSALFAQLVYARQDQHHDLWRLHRDRAAADDDDALLAIKCLSEGEGQYLFLTRLFTKDGKEENLPRALLYFARRSRRDALAQSRASIEKMDNNADLLEALERIEQLPAFMYRRFVDPPLKGALLIHRVKKAGGWAAVDALWKEPPTSTAQVVHPELRLGTSADAKRFDATRVDLGDLSSHLGEGWRRAVQTTIGQMAMESIFEEVLGESSGEVEKNVVGDRAQLYEGPAGERTVVWFSTWTGAETATTFVKRYEQLLAKKHPGRELERKGDGARASDGKVTTLVEQRHEDVVVLIDAPEEKVQPLVAAALEARKTKDAAHPYAPR